MRSHSAIRQVHNTSQAIGLARRCLVISLIIPNYNKLPYLRETLASAIVQTSVSEIIVVDDASTDGSVEYLRTAATSDPRIIVVASERKHNASYCRNRGLDRATNPYVIFLDSDDLLSPACCRNRLELASRHPEHDLWVFPMRVFRESTTQPLDTWVPRPGNHLRHFLSHRLDWQTMQPLWRRAFLDRIGGFDESFGRLQDPELHTRALLAGAHVKCFPDAEPDCFYRAFNDARVDVTQLSRRSVEATLRFYHMFIEKVPTRLQKDLAGTLLASLSQHIHWWRRRRLPTATFTAAAREIIGACDHPYQRRLLSAYIAFERTLPFHVPGINRAVQLLLGLPARP